MDTAWLGRFGYTAPQVSSQEGAETVTLRKEAGGEPLRLGLGWIPPGPRLLLTSVSTAVRERQGLRKVQVSYGRFGERKDRHAPQDVTLSVEPDFELKLLWREREWLDEAPDGSYSAFPRVGRQG